MIRSTGSIFLGLVAALFLPASPALAQITTGTITGRVVDSTGGVVSGARVALVSEARGTRSAAMSSPTIAATTSSRTSQRTRTPSRSPPRRSRTCDARESWSAAPTASACRR